MDKSKKIMSKEEVGLLIELIQRRPVLNSKETNAKTNKVKEDAWNAVTSLFNANSGSAARTKQQLKLKWDNLKKAARKQTQIQINNSKLGGGKTDFIPTDGMLEKVANILESSLEQSMAGDSAKPDISNDVELLDNISNRGTRERKRKVLASYDTHSPAAKSSRSDQDCQVTDQSKPLKKDKQKMNHDGRLIRNLAIAEYFNKKTQKLQLEIEILQLELEKKRNMVNNILD